VGIFVSINIYLYYGLTTLKNQHFHHPNSLALIRLLDQKFTDHYAFITIDWGMYHMKALYGKKHQCVLYVTPLDTVEKVERIQDVLKQIDRKALFIGMEDSESDLHLIRENFAGLVVLETPFDTGKWRVWYEE